MTALTVVSFIGNLNSNSELTPCDERHPQVRDPVTQIGKTVFHLSHQGENDKEIMEVLSSLYDSAIVPINIPQPPEPSNNGKIRIAFVSTLIYDHSIGKMMIQVMRSLSSTFEIIAIGTNYPYYNSNDGLGIPESDDAVISHALNYVSKSSPLPSNLNDAVVTLSRVKPDIIFYPDIGMSPLTYFLARIRLAPIQSVWWGHPITTGLEEIDFFFGLDYELEDVRGQYSEQIVRFEYINTAPFASVPDGPEVTDELTYFGIKNNESSDCSKTNVYMVLGRLFKIHTSFETLMFRILEEDTCGVIVLITEKQVNWNNQVHDRITRHFHEWSVGKPEDNNILNRIRYVSYWNYVRILAHADTILDTYPYGGCLTAQEGLSNGKVVITLPSDYVRGRFAGKMLEQMGVASIIARDEDDYVRKAVKVATDGEFREAVKRETRKGWEEEIHKDSEVAEEWGSAFLEIYKSAHAK